MALSVNLAQINSAAKGNSDLRETLTGIHLALQSALRADGHYATDQDRRERRTLHVAAGAFSACGDWSEWELHGFHHDTAERLRSQGAEQCNQRAHLSRAIQLTGGQFCFGGNDLPRQHQHELCLSQSWRDSVLAAAIEL